MPSKRGIFKLLCFLKNTTEKEPGGINNKVVETTVTVSIQLLYYFTDNSLRNSSSFSLNSIVMSNVNFFLL